MKGKTILFIAIQTLACFFAACNKDDVITGDDLLAPVITLDSETAVYTVKVGRQLVIAPKVENATGASYTWISDGSTLATTPSLAVTYDEPQTVYVTFRVETEAGMAEEDLRIDVLEAMAPKISMAVPADGFVVLPGAELALVPDIKNADVEGFTVEWTCNGQKVGDELAYTFCQTALGDYNIEVKAENEDGADALAFNVAVSETLPFSISFPTSSYFSASTDRNALKGRPLFLVPILQNIAGEEVEWWLDGQNIGRGEMLKFMPEAVGDYVVTASYSYVKAYVAVHVYDNESAGQRLGGSNMRQDKVYEFVPAPGQFINNPISGGYPADVTTHAKAVEYAQGRLEAQRYVSLGGFGGYIVVGFDHSIPNTGAYDFAIQGNAFVSTSGSSNEPGIVWVMQDTNGNGLPDDEWYELAGSETEAGTAVSNYAVTYYRPSAPNMDVQWTDSEGNSGTVDYLPTTHKQDFYYPLWIEADSYTLRGTRLPAKNTYDSSTGDWANHPFAWGYVDNVGSDNIEGDLQRTAFKISNAIHPDGSKANLKYIDFIKVQTGCNTKSGHLGENSCEVAGFEQYGN